MISKDEFKQVVQNTALITIDFIIYNSENKILLGKRTNSPAKGFYFTPGGRIFKNETFDKAIERLSKKELNIKLKQKNLKFNGICEQFYDDSIFENIGVHCVGFIYECWIQINLNELPDIEHCEYKYMTRKELLGSNLVHKYVKDFIKLEGVT